MIIGINAFGRLLVYVYQVDGTWINGAMVAEDLARVRWDAPDTRYNAALQVLEGQGEAAAVGGWAACGWACLDAAH